MYDSIEEGSVIFVQSLCIIYIHFCGKIVFECFKFCTIYQHVVHVELVQYM